MLVFCCNFSFSSKNDQAHGMLKYIEEVLFAPKTFAHVQSTDAKQGETGNGNSSNQISASRDFPEEYKLQFYMVGILACFNALCYS